MSTPSEDVKELMIELSKKLFETCPVRLLNQRDMGQIFVIFGKELAEANAMSEPAGRELAFMKTAIMIHVATAKWLGLDQLKDILDDV